MAGWLWEIHHIEYQNPAVGGVSPAAGVAEWQASALSWVPGQAAMPVMTDPGVLIRTSLTYYGPGTYITHIDRQPMETVTYYPRPLLYAKDYIYSYTQKNWTGTDVYYSWKIGYTIRKASGNLLWETVEQYMAGL